MAVFSGSAMSALITAAAGWKLSSANAKKVAFENIKAAHADSAEVERVINERIRFVFDANDEHIRHLSEEIGRLRKQVETLTAELHAARREISQMRAERGQPAGQTPPDDVADILNREF